MPRLRAADPKSSITPPLPCPLPHRHSDYLSFASRASRPCALPAPGRWSLAWPRRVSRSVNNWLVQVLVPGLGGSPRDPPLSLCQESLREPREGPENLGRRGSWRSEITNASDNDYRACRLDEQVAPKHVVSPSSVSCLPRVPASELPLWSTEAGPDCLPLRV